MSYKPQGYNSLSPYFIVDDPKALIKQLLAVFNGVETRRFQDEDGRIMHAELKIDDSVLMLSQSTPDYPAHKLMMHLYVKDAKDTYEKAISNGCTPISEPVNQEGDPDLRGSFYDLAGNHWSVGTQIKSLIMSPRQVIERWVELFNQHDAIGLGQLYHEDAVNHQVVFEPVTGRKQIQAMFEQEFERAEMVCLVEQILEDGDWAILEWKDPLGLRGCGFFQVNNGKIKYQRGYWDQLTFLRAQNLPLPTE